jgi:hypothetical protein
MVSFLLSNNDDDEDGGDNADDDDFATLILSRKVLVALLVFSLRPYSIVFSQVQALKLAVVQQHGIPLAKIGKFLIAGENLTVSCSLCSRHNPPPTLS